MPGRDGSGETAIERHARDYPAGAVLFREGDSGDAMYVIQTGSVEIRRLIGDQERVLAVLPAGEFLGEMALLNHRPRSATAVVREPSRLLVIDGLVAQLEADLAKIHITDGQAPFRLVRNVLIHEIAHHFGFSDADMEALESEAKAEAGEGADANRA